MCSRTTYREGDLPRNIDVEQMDLSMNSNQVACQKCSGQLHQSRMKYNADLLAYRPCRCYKASQRSPDPSQAPTLIELLSKRDVLHQSQASQQTSNQPDPNLLCCAREHLHAFTLATFHVILVAFLISNRLCVLWEEIIPVGRVKAFLMPHMKYSINIKL